MSKIISIIGGNGYVGKRCIQSLLTNEKDIKKIYAISRNPNLNLLNKFDDRVEFIKGDALKPDELSIFLEKSSGIIHTVGKLISTKMDDYEKTNYQTAINIAEIANNLSGNLQKNFVYISAERGLVFPLSLAFSGYIETKRKAEVELLKKYPKLNTIILRPGLITDMKERPYVMPISAVFGIINVIENNFLNKLSHNAGDQLGLPSKGIELDTLSIYAAAGALGKLNEKIYSNDYMNNLENIRKIKFINI